MTRIIYQIHAQLLMTVVDLKWKGLDNAANLLTHHILQQRRERRLGLFTVPYYGYGRILYGHFTGTFTRQPYRIKKLKNTERYGTGKKTGIRP